MKKKLATILGLCSFPLPLLAQGEPDLNNIKIENVTYSGTGCPENRDDFFVSDDGQAITMLFNNFVVSLNGAPVPGIERDRKNCKIQFLLKAPSNWSYSIFYLSHSGFADLDQNATGIQDTTYRFSNTPQPVKLGKFKLQGPFKDNFIRVDELPLNTTPWSTCNVNSMLTIDTSIAVRSARNATGFMGIDSVDGEFTHNYGIAWKKCGGPANPNHKFNGLCRTLVKKPNGTQVGMVIAQANAKNADQAINKAKNRLQKKCDRRTQRGNICKVEEATCSSTAL